MTADSEQKGDRGTVARWLPPEEHVPSRWQLAKASEALGQWRKDLEAALRGVVGDVVEVGRVSVFTDLPPGRWIEARADVVTEDVLAAAMVSALLGFSGPAAVDLRGSAEKALLAWVAEAMRQWARDRIGPRQDKGDGDKVWIVAEVRCGDVSGAAAVQVAWRALWRHTQQWLADNATRVCIPAQQIQVEVEARMPGPKVSLARLMALQVGEFLPLPGGSKSRVAVVIDGRKIATGRLGARRGRKAIKIERAMSEGRDGGRADRAGR